MANLLDGNALSATIRAEIKAELDRRSDVRWKLRRNDAHATPPPCLAVVLCSDDPASEIYVRRKQAACKEVGIHSTVIRPFDGGIENWTDPMGHLLKLLDWLNDDCSIHGILVQLPLPAGLDQYRVFDHLNPLKDVDVFHPENVGLLLQGRPRFVPCTPAAVRELLTRNGVAIEGKKVAIVNRSDVVGKPLKALLIQNNDQANATVTMCHDRTPPCLLRDVCRSADIIVVAVGKPGFLTADLVSDGAVVVDVGINRQEGSKKIVGDVDFEPVARKASWISPVPGGVGPMTVTMLLRNTIAAQQLLLTSQCADS